MKTERVLERHLAHWREAGLVSDELVSRLRLSSAELGERSSVPWTRWALVVLGSGLVLAGLILVIAENWSRIHRFGKLAGWIAIYLLLIAFVRRSGRISDRPILPEALAFVAGGWLFGGIVLVSQIYHLTSRPANGFWLWLALALPLCFVLSLRSPALVVFAALVAALTAEVTDPDSWVRATSGAGPWLWLAVPCLAAWLVSWLPKPIPWLTGIVGVWWVFVSNLFLLVLGASQDLDHSDLGGAWWLAGLGLAMSVLWPSRTLPASWGRFDSRLIVVLSLSPWILLGAEYHLGETLDLIAIGVAWAVQLIVAVVLIRAGAAQGRSLWINLGFLALLFGIVVRYFDLFGDYLEGGTMLALTGVLILFIGATLERQRRRTVAQAGGES